MRRVAMRKDRQGAQGRRSMNDHETDLVLGQVCVTLANLLLFGSTAAQSACFTDLVEMSRAKELSPYQRAALRSVADAISAYHAKVWEIEQDEKAEGFRLTPSKLARSDGSPPVLVESGGVAAYRVIDADSGAASAVNIDRS
jgi:hypothetical protein